MLPAYQSTAQADREAYGTARAVCERAPTSSPSSAEESSESTSPAASYIPKLRPWPASGWTTCAASPTSASLPDDVHFSSCSRCR